MDTYLSKRREFVAAVLSGIDRAGAKRMEYGMDDCAMWVADIQRDILGYDPAARVRGRYKTRLGALRVVGVGGLLGQVKAIARRHGWRQIKPEFAQPGDTGLAWTMIEARGKQVPVLATVVCRANGWFVGRNEGGVTALRAKDVAFAWSVLDDAVVATLGERVNLSRLQMGSNLRYSAQMTQEPISLALISTFTAVGFSAATAAILSSVVIGATLSIGVSMVASLLRPSQGSGLSNNLSNADQIASVQVTERQPVPIKRVIVGRAYVGGAMCFEKVTPPKLTVGVLFNYGEIDAVEKVYIGTNQLSFASIVPNTILTPLAVDGQPAYSTKLRVSFRYGSLTQSIDPLFRENYATPFVLASAGTRIGNMTAGAGLAGAFDGVTAQDSGSGASLSGTTNLVGTIGKDWGTGTTKYISKFRFYAPNSGAMGLFPVVVTLEGSNDNFVSDINVLATVASATYATSTITTISTGIDVSTPYQQHRLKFTESGASGSHQFACVEVQFWESIEQNFRQAGNATAFYEYSFGADQAEFTSLWGQVARPNAYVVTRGVKAYDPRDLTQSKTDASTWKWTNNATLVQTWYLTRPFGGRISMDRIRWDKTAASADYDDSLIGCADGTMIARHTIDGVITLNQRPYEVFQKLLTANRATLLDAGGMKWIQSSQPKTAVATIHDRCIASGIKWVSARQKDQIINKLQLRLVSPDAEYQLVDGPILDRTDLQAIDDEVLTGTLALEYTQDHRRAQRLQKLFLLSSRLGKTIQVSTDLSPMVAAARAGEELIGSVVNFNSVLFPKFNGTYMVTAVGFADDATTLSLALAEYDPTIETQWNPEIDEQDFIPLAA